MSEVGFAFAFSWLQLFCFRVESRLESRFLIRTRFLIGGFNLLVYVSLFLTVVSCFSVRVAVTVRKYSSPVDELIVCAERTKDQLSECECVCVCICLEEVVMKEYMIICSPFPYSLD